MLIDQWTHFPRSPSALVEYLKAYPFLKVKFSKNDRNEQYVYQGYVITDETIKATFSTSSGTLISFPIVCSANIQFHTDGFIETINKTNTTTYLYTGPKPWQPDISPKQLAIFEWDRVFEEFKRIKAKC
jgi:hypothetical protein